MTLNRPTQLLNLTVNANGIENYQVPKYQYSQAPYGQNDGMPYMTVMTDISALNNCQFHWY